MLLICQNATMWVHYVGGSREESAHIPTHLSKSNFIWWAVKMFVQFQVTEHMPSPVPSVCKRAYLGRKRDLTWAVGTLSQGSFFSLTAVKIWQAVVATVPGWNVLLYLGFNTYEYLCYTYVYIKSERQLCIYLHAFLIPYYLTPRERMVK